MEAITVYKCDCVARGDNISPHCPMHGMIAIEYYPKAEADTVIARLKENIRIYEQLGSGRMERISELEADLFQAQAKSSRLEARCGDLQDEVAKRDHQIKVLNADLTRCQDSKAKIGDKILRLQAAAENILFKRNANVPLEAVDFEWLERAANGD